MVIASLRLTPPPGASREIIRALHFVSGAARVEVGCLACHVYQDIDRPEIVYVEEWSDARALERRVRSAHYAQLLEVMESSATRPQLEFHFASETRGLDYVEALRGGGTRPAR